MFGKPVSRERIMAFSRDGVFDIAVGVMLIGAGAYLYFDLIALGGIFVVLILPLIQGLKAAITVPRLAVEEQPEYGAVRIFRGLLVSAVLLGVLFTAAVAIFMFDRAGNMPGWLDGWLADALPIALLTIVGVFLLVGTYATRNWRLVAYAVLVAATYAALHWLELSLPLGLVALGVVAIAIGIVLALRFVRTHPVLPAEKRVQFR